MNGPSLSECLYLGCLVSRSRTRGYIQPLAELCGDQLAFRVIFRSAPVLECDPMNSLPLGSTVRFSTTEKGRAKSLVPAGTRLIKLAQYLDSACMTFRRGGEAIVYGQFG